ncbi:MAG TPA: flagellar motor protein MotB [Desulfitobacteriaceae bacterium]|nr:flagellar motor protein MotB [Desulfitobacteriaceae bacterium]
MARKKKPEPEKENNERWLLTYSDLITLLMIFFVVLYAMSNVDAQKFRAVADSLNKALGGGRPAALDINEKPGGPKVIGETTPQLSTEKATDNKNESDTKKINLENITIEEIKAKLDNYAAENNIQNKLVSSMEERGLVVSIKDTLLFDSGSAVISTSAHELLEKIGRVLLVVPNYIRIEGHTDNVPISTQQFQSNWELSVLRATNVLQLMVKEGHISPNRLSAAGYGEFRPIASNTDAEGHARNRRVDIVILKTKYDIIEPGEKSVTNP